MSRNRFSDFIARRKSQHGPSHSPAGSDLSLEDAGGGADMEKYFSTLSGIEKDIDVVDSNVDVLSHLHNKLLSSADGSKSESITHQLDKKTSQTNELITKLKRELHGKYQISATIGEMKQCTLTHVLHVCPAVEQMNEGIQMSPSEEATRRGRHAALVRRLMAVLEKYRTLERESQRRYRARMERHIRLGMN
ncbi:hypothetical protein GGI12_003289 [Dipsacomyces acuminosporus]|nr:hypothetical protein GGI12_003289 [Dipsacomyces acuminosporus]